MVRFAYATKTKESITSKKLGSQNFCRIEKVVLNKGKSATPRLFNRPEVMSSTSDKANVFASNSNLDGSGISLPVFQSRTIVKLHNISITLKMVKKVITKLDPSKASGPDCIPVVVLKNFTIEKRNRIVNHLENCGLFSDFQYGSRSSQSTTDLLTVVSERIARAFNRSGATRTVALDISKTFDRVWQTGLLHKLKSYGISCQIFGIISSFLSSKRLRVVLDGKSLQEHPVNAGVRSSIFGPTLFLLYINDLPDDVIFNIALYADGTTLYSKCDQAFDVATTRIGF